MKPTIITVFSDATISGNRCGCGWWFKSDKASGQGSLFLESDTLNIHEAELWGIKTGLEEAAARHEGDIIFVMQCDNLGALQALQHLNRHKTGTSVFWAKTSAHKLMTHRKRLTDFERELLTGIRNLGADKIYLKHVKGHTGNADARSHINRLTDELAKQARIQ